MKQPGEFERCESTLLSGWHRFNSNAQISTTPVVAGQCGSSAPIYLQGMKINGFTLVQLIIQMTIYSIL
jgi:hypothetical protein